MRDVIVLAVIAAFFAVCIAYVRWCDRIIGPDPGDLHDDEIDGASAVDPHELVAADGAIPAEPVLDVEGVGA